MHECMFTHHLVRAVKKGQVTSTLAFSLYRLLDLELKRIGFYPTPLLIETYSAEFATIWKEDFEPLREMLCLLSLAKDRD